MAWIRRSRISDGRLETIRAGYKCLPRSGQGKTALKLEPVSLFDTVLRNAHVIDPSQNIDGVLDVAIRDGVIAGLGAPLEGSPGSTDIDLTGHYVCPGLIDLHGHWFEGSAYGVDPNLCLNHGVTTVVDAGTTGFINFAEFRRNRIDTSRIGILAFLNISGLGIPTALAGELENLQYARPGETA